MYLKECDAPIINNPIDDLMAWLKCSKFINKENTPVYTIIVKGQQSITWVTVWAYLNKRKKPRSLDTKLLSEIILSWKVVLILSPHVYSMFLYFLQWTYFVTGIWGWERRREVLLLSFKKKNNWRWNNWNINTLQSPLPLVCLKKC